MAKGLIAEKKAKNMWKMAVLTISVVILAYLVFLTTNDARWIFTNMSSTFLIGFLAVVAIVIYLLKLKGPNAKA